MGSKRALTRTSKQAAVKSAVACLFATAIVLTSALAAAQDRAGPAGAKTEDHGFFGSIVRWFDAQAEYFNSTLKNTGKRIENFGHEAGIAARTTIDTAKDAAGVVARIPNTRVVVGHEKCKVAPNGAPDCGAAANAVCKAKGFGSGKSVDMTTAENCPARVWISGSTTGLECKTETFVSRAICQ